MVIVCLIWLCNLMTYPHCADDFKLVWLPPCMIRRDGAWRLRSSYVYGTGNSVKSLTPSMKVNLDDFFIKILPVPNFAVV